MKVKFSVIDGMIITNNNWRNNYCHRGFIDQTRTIVYFGFQWINFASIVETGSKIATFVTFFLGKLKQFFSASYDCLLVRELMISSNDDIHAYMYKISMVKWVPVFFISLARRGATKNKRSCTGPATCVIYTHSIKTLAYISPSILNDRQAPLFFLSTMTARDTCSLDFFPESHS